jgi:hypothetical protein
MVGYLDGGGMDAIVTVSINPLHGHNRTLPTA